MSTFTEFLTHLIASTPPHNSSPVVETTQILAASRSSRDQLSTTTARPGQIQMNISLSFSGSASAADWLLRSQTPASQLITFGPAGFEDYARLRYLRDPRRPDEAEGRRPADRPTPITVARRALHILAAHTGTPDDAYFCLWVGYSDVPARSVPLEAVVHLPGRDYALLRGPLTAAAEWEAVLGLDPHGHVPPPAFVWPADHRWCYASDVDPHWAGVGASRSAIEALLADQELDVIRARPADPQPYYRS